MYLTEASVLQICSAGQRLFALTRESGKSVISYLDLETWQWNRVTETVAEISRFAVAGSRLYYLADEAIFYRDLDTGHSSALLRRIPPNGAFPVYVSVPQTEFPPVRLLWYGEIDTYWA